MSYVLKNIENINNAGNEILNRHTINRNFLKLLENDKILDSLMNSPIINKTGITPYLSTKIYNKNDLIWYKDFNQKTNQPVLYILRSLCDNNSSKPEKTYYDKVETFEDSGWKDEYEYGSIIENSILTYLGIAFNRNIEANHILNSTYHKFGQLTEDKTYDDSKLLNRNLDNLVYDRPTNHFPYQTISLSIDNVVQNGYYRKWNCGILEYFIIFKLGFYGQYNTVNDIKYEILSANVLSSVEDKYLFSSGDDKLIFNQPGNLSVYINDMYQVGLNSECNNYSGVINFPEAFKDTNYMVFAADIACQDRNTYTPTIDSGVNTMIYVNKNTNSITPLLIIQPKENAVKSGLVSNNFSCKIIGRWK